MEHRHLLPNELDLLVDGDVGVAPLRAHLGECPECRARYDGIRRMAETVEALPHFTPKMRFADGIMTRVQVAEPWHVAAMEFGRRLVPSSAPVRLLLGAGAGATALVISGGAAWLAFRGDLAGWLVSLLSERARQLLESGAREVAAGVLGADATSALATGGPATLGLISAVLGLSVIGAVLGFRRLAATAHADRR